MISVGLILLILPSLLGIVVAGTNVLDADLHISREVQRWSGHVPETLQRIGDTAGSTASAITVLIVCLAVTLVARWRLDTAFVLVVAFFRLVGMVLKTVFDSPRPTDDVLRLLREYHSTGYPSGHSMTMAMIATTVAFLVWRHLDSMVIRAVCIAIGTLLTILVGWSRIWSGAHWPSDVLGGWMYGVGFVVMAAWIAYRPRLTTDADQVASQPTR